MSKSSVGTYLSKTWILDLPKKKIKKINKKKIIGWCFGVYRSTIYIRVLYMIELRHPYSEIPMGNGVWATILSVV